MAEISTRAVRALTDTHTDIHTDRQTTVTLLRMRRGLIIKVKSVIIELCHKYRMLYMPWLVNVIIMP